jgi:hypothetical protein
VIAMLAPLWTVAAPIDVLIDCAASASPAAVGIKNLRTPCPELEGALGALRIDELMAVDWRQQMSAATLRDLSHVYERYDSAAPRAAARTSTLPAILDALSRETPRAAGTWWDSVKQWLNRWLTQSDSLISKWVNRWLERWQEHGQVSSVVLELISYALTALVVCAAILIIVREIRAAGLLGNRVRKAKRGSTDRLDGAIAIGFAGPESGFGRNDVTDLFRTLVRRLVQTGRLRAERSLTHRQLVLSTEFDSDLQRASFAGIALRAESILYGPVTSEPAQTAQAIEQGTALLAQLSHSTSTR